MFRTNKYDGKRLRVETIEETDGKISYLIGIVIVLASILVYCTSIFAFKTLPEPVQLKELETNPSKFNGENAYIYLKELYSIGQKVVGSSQNEVDAVNFFINRFRDIDNSKGDLHTLEIDLQKASGSYFLDFQPNAMAVTYQNIQNVVIRISPKTNFTRGSLLINSHYDTVPVSPGAGDAGIMVTVMLEVLRALSRLYIPLNHSIIFLFNGAEENPLMGSHAFITQHKWATDVKAFLNLDSSGTGGREIMFQAGPENPWLMKHYKENAPYPYGSAMGEELFQSNMIPSDTDFRNFRDFGGIPGMDFATSENGYIYHTKYDKIELVPLGTIQHIGENLLATAQSLVNSEEFKNPKDYTEGKVIYFDYLGWFMIFYTETIGYVINSVISVAYIFGLILYLKFMCDELLSFKRCLIEFGITFGVQLISLGCATGFVLLLAVIYDAANRSMSWFSNTWLLFGIYICPFIFILAMGPSLYIQFKKTKDMSTDLRVQLFVHVQCLIYVILVVLLMALKIRSAFIIIPVILFHTIAMYINLLTRWQNHSHRWIWIHCIAQLFPFMFYAYLCLVSLNIFIPLAGRHGPASNPDILISMNVTGMTMFMVALLVPILSLCRRSKLLISSFFALFIIAVIMMATPLGFPYRAETSPQRYWVFHTTRTIHLDKTNFKQEYGFFSLSMDRHSADNLPQIENAVYSPEDCKKYLYCGLPFYTSRMMGQANYSYWVPTEVPPYLFRQPKLKCLDRSGETTITYEFQLEGPNHMAFYISPNLNVNLSNWSFIDFVPRSGPYWNGRRTYFSYFSYAALPLTTDKFTLTFEVPVNYNDVVFDIAMVAHVTFRDEDRTSAFNDYIASFPSFAHVTPWINSYESWTFY